MGRCYEFGVSLHDECEQAMVVPSEGGHCICASCGADCPGQFNACGVVVAKPGYVPVTAPDWAKPGHRRPGSATSQPSAPSAASVRPALDAPDVPRARHILDVEPPAPTPAAVELREVGSELATVRSLLEAVLDRPDRLNEALAVLNQELKVRDGELAAAFARMTSAYEQLTQEVLADREARQAIVAGLEKLAERVDGVERATRTRPIFGLGGAGRQ